MIRRRTALRGALTLPLLLPGCGLLRRRPALQPPQPRYVIGPAYQAGGAWYYPAERFTLDQTGLAEAWSAPGGLTANGERWNPDAMAAAHQTLQLPAIVRVTNLETGLQALLRVNERGPANPARLLGLSRRAAEVLGVRGAVQVRVEVEGGMSQALRDRLQGGGQGITTAPRAAVVSEALAPPPGVGQSGRGRAAAGTRPLAGAEQAAEAVPDRLPEVAVQVGARPGRLWLWAGEFGQRRYADQVQARLSPLRPGVERLRDGRSEVFRVRAGPFPTVAEADSALDRARAAGVTDARLVVV